MDFDTVTGCLDEFCSFVESEEFHPDIYVTNYGIRNHCPAMVVLKMQGYDRLDRLQILAANGASWRCYPEDFMHALYLCLAPNEESLALLKTLMAMPFASSVNVRTLLLETWGDDHYMFEVFSLMAYGFWWHRDTNHDIVSQIMTVLQLTTDDFEPYFYVQEFAFLADGPVKVLHAAACHRWSSRRAAWISAVVCAR